MYVIIKRYNFFLFFSKHMSVNFTLFNGLVLSATSNSKPNNFYALLLQNNILLNPHASKNNISTIQMK